MYTPRIRLFIAMILPFILIGFSAAACNIPFIPISTTATGVSGTPGSTKTVKPTILEKTHAIPGNILTEVAATIKAGLTQKAPAAKPPGTPGAPTSDVTPPDVTMPEPPQAPYPAPFTFTPTNTLTSQAPSTPTHTNTPTPTRTKFSLPYTPRVLGPRSGGYSTYGFKVKGFNIHWCGGVPWAIFLINNLDYRTLESMVLHLYDTDTNQTLSGPIASNTPFMSTDKTCVFGGIGSLASGRSLYIGNSLGWGSLKGHTIQATITLCTENGLGGTCHQKIVEFVVP